MNFLYDYIVERNRKTPGKTVQHEIGIISENPLDYPTTIFANNHDSIFSKSAETSLRNRIVVNSDGVFDFITPIKAIFMTNEPSALSINQNATTQLLGTSK